jgi:hypothetical protein
LYESRRQHAMDVAMQAKAEVKNINKNILWFPFARDWTFLLNKHNPCLLFWNNHAR